MSQVTAEFGLVANFTVPAPPNKKFEAFRDKYLKHIRDARQAGEEWAKYYNVNRFNRTAATAPLFDGWLQQIEGLRRVA